ncbi:unnamed protein product [Symbiodinium sp. CCMP2592]|nr:unnamed protein product [Symbiodinium sp. CCMP2592]
MARQQHLRQYTFILSANTAPGDTIKLVGDHEALGRWDVSLGKEMQCTNFPKWTVEVNLLPSAEFRYKYVKVRVDGHHEWELESGDNRHFRGHRHLIEDEFNVRKPPMPVEDFLVVPARNARGSPEEEVQEGSHVGVIFHSNTFAHLDFVKREFANVKAELEELRGSLKATTQALKKAAGEDSKMEAQVNELRGRLEDFQAEQAEQKKAQEQMRRSFSDLRLEAKADRLVPQIFDKIKAKAIDELLPRILAQLREDLLAEDARPKTSAQTSPNARAEDCAIQDVGLTMNPKHVQAESKTYAS